MNRALAGGGVTGKVRMNLFPIDGNDAMNLPKWFPILSTDLVLIALLRNKNNAKVGEGRVGVAAVKVTLSNYKQSNNNKK